MSDELHLGRTINAGGHGPGGAGDLAREAGALDRLRSLLDLVLVAAAMGGDHLARPGLHVHYETARERGIFTQHEIPNIYQ